MAIRYSPVTMVDTIVAGLRDCVFFLVIGFLGHKHVIGEPILAALLSAYTAHRFGVSMGKQQAIVSLNNSGGGGGTGTSGTMRAVDPSLAATRRVEPPRNLSPHDDADGGLPISDVVPGSIHRSLSLDTGAYSTIASSIGGIG